MTRTATILLVAMVCAAIAGSAPAGAPAGAKKTPTVARPRDLCKDCVDPYNPTGERAKFFTAAGVDNELAAKEFEVDRRRKDGFVRKFDTWAGLLAFDKNSNEKIDWFEADAYRRSLRARILKAYDANKDGQLKDKERDAANRALEAGKLPAAGGKATGVSPRPLPARQPGQGGNLRPMAGGQGGIVVGGGQAGPMVIRRAGGPLSDEARLRMFDKNKDGKLDADEQTAAGKYEEDRKRRQEQWAREAAERRKIYQDLVKKHDADGDGRITGDERKGFYDEYRKAWQLRRWDKDGDGKLSEAEKEAKQAQEAEWKRRSEEARQRWMLQRWDKDKDGAISAEEKSAMEAYQAEMKKRAEQARREYAELRKQHDTDGDGRLNAEERKAYSEALRRRWELRRWDKNGDGKLDEAEREQMKQDRAKWRQPRVLINGRPVEGGGGVVRQSEDGRSTVIIRPVGGDQRDE